MCRKSKTMLLLVSSICITFNGLTSLAAIGNTMPADQNFLDKQAAVFSDPPDKALCRPGRLKETEKQNALSTLNAIRALHRLPLVAYSAESDPAVMASSLMMAANGDIRHRPPTNWRCYSEIGAQAAKSGNLSGGVVSPYLKYSSARDSITGWITDERNRSGGTGHRRWMLSPFLTQIAYGHVGWEDSEGNRSAASTLKLFEFASEKPVQADIPDFVAYPFGNYPTEYFAAGALLSFMPVVDKVDRWKNMQVDLGGARVTVTADGHPVSATLTSRSNEAFGYTTALEFHIDALATNVRYHVNVSGLTYQDKPLVYDYEFKLIE